MKKTTLYCFYLFLISFLPLSAQVLNEPANWPSTSWTISGSYYVSAGLFEGNPLINPNFAYDDYASGSGVPNQIAAESPIIDLNSAVTAGETDIFVQTLYVYNFEASETLVLQYYNADTGNWVNWQAPFNSDTPGFPPADDYCSGTQANFVSQALDVSGFSANQLSNFQYRFYFNDNSSWAKGFCFSSPTIYSDEPITCFIPSNLSVVTFTDTTVTLDWNPGDMETAWEVAVVPTGSTTPSSGTSATTNNNYTYNGLSETTTYDVYVRSDCGGGDYSDWYGPISFTTAMSTPTPPSGVSCTSGTGTYMYIEEFDNSTGWTGDVNSGNGSWEIPNGSTTVGTGPSSAYSGSNYMNFEATATMNGDVGTIISPAIDLANVTGEAELSFYMHAFGLHIGTFELGISTSPTGTFTTIFTLTDQYQTSATDPWLPVGIDITAYAGQTIYLQFKQTAVDGPLGDMAIDLLRIEACGNFCITPTSITTSDITDTSVDISWTSNGNETLWEYVIQPAGTGIPTSGTEVTTTSLDDISGLTPDTDYEVYVRAICATNFFSNWEGPANFTTSIQTDFIVDCGLAPTNMTYCYENLENTTFHFTSTDPNQYLLLNFNSGMVEDGGDQITIYDSDATTILYQGYGTSGDLSGLSFQATGSEIYLEIISNTNVSCDDGGISTPLDFDVSCISCYSPTVDYQVIGNCVIGLDFNVEVNITAMGSASSLVISDDAGLYSQTVNSAGVYTFGPYAFSNPIEFQITDPTDSSCSITSPPLVPVDCPPIVISDTDYTVDQLIKDVLINESCSTASNIQYSTGSNYGNVNGIGSFSAAWNFPIQEGIILSTGDIFTAEGPNVANHSGGTTTWPSDADLTAISGPGFNASYIEFDFVPQVEHISFDYIFASEEYLAQFECNFSDVFAFLLTDQNGNTTNMAVLPNSNIPVTVVNVHGGIGACGPANAQYFDTYNASGTGEIDFNGQTVVLTAESDVIPGQTYHLKLAIQDNGDSNYDSAVFLSSHTLNLGFCPPDNNFICYATPLTTLPLADEGSVDGYAYDLQTAFDQTNEPVGSCYSSGLDGTVWFEFVAPPTGEVKINTYHPTGATTDVEFAVYSSNSSFDCTDITTLGSEVACASGSTTLSLNGSNALTPGETYYIQVNNPDDLLDSFGIEVLYFGCSSTSYTTPTIVPDCTNDEFSISFNVTDLGNGTPVLTDGTTVWNVTLGTNLVGPFTNGTNVSLVLEHGLDTDCDIDLGAFTYVCPPECASNVVITDNGSCGNYPADITWDTTLDAEGYYISMGTSPGGTDILNNIDLGNVTAYTTDFLTVATTYYVTITPYNTFGTATSCTEYNFTTAATPCYCESIPTSNDLAGITNVTIESTSNSIPDVTYYEIIPVVSIEQGANATVDITFATGIPYDANIWIDFNDNYTFDASELVYSGTSASANPTVLSATFTVPASVAVGQHKMRIGTAFDGQTPPNPCYSGPQGVTIDANIDVIPMPCSAAAYASATVVTSCTTSQFYVDVDITDLGNGAPSITDGTSTWPVTATGITQVGPFADASTVTLTLEHGTDTTCDVDLGSFTYTCPFVCNPASYTTIDIAEDCVNSQFYVYIDITNIGDGSSVVTDGISSWPITTTGITQIGPFLDGDNVTLTLENGTSASCSEDLGSFTYTCPFVCSPAAYTSATLNADCDNSQFYVDVDITDLGNGTPAITDGITTWPVTATGITQVGPFADGTSTVLVLEHGLNNACDVDLGTFTYTCPLVCSSATYTTATVNEDCDNAQFYVDIDITDLGNGTPSITDGTSTWPVTTTGITQVGPFADATTVALTLEHGTDATCDVDLGTYTYSCPFVCSPATYASTTINEDCDNAQFYVDIDITDLGNGSPAITDGTTTWPITATGITQVGPFADATTVALTLEHGTDATCDIDLGTYTYTCPFVCSPATYASTTINEDCDNALFYVDIDITDLGNGSPAITDGTTTWPITATGITQVGPFADATTVALTLEHGTDATCNVDLGTYTYSCPFVCSPATYASTTINEDCDNALFYVDIDITDLGNGSPAITDGTTTWPITTTGITQVGPFADATTVALTLEHGTDATCDVDLGTYTYTCTVTTPPANDDACNATNLTVLDLSNAGSTPGDAFTTIDATSQISETVPSCFNGSIEGSVWFSFTAPSTGEVLVTTDLIGGTLLDTEVAVYSSLGADCNDVSGLSPIACMQDNGSNIPQSTAIYFDGTTNATLTPGATYYVQVDAGTLGAQGTFGIEVINLDTTTTASTDAVNFTYYPNPVNHNILNIRASKPMNTIEVLNILGQSVLHLTPNSSEYAIQMHDLAAGNYLVKITIGDHQEIVKIIKE
ncbi:choice-of-anchor L domain-containing protein [Neptunitalea lumnitzerae]|uniref:Uncharacterized protein n=1 Tax=Neptunitalea lumnitzerae TaxID=2965509 RepID=A0ABQ5MHI8_9FLAO|nr:choice-of-anchor L domain-containing protein [Neptunitalea sp. Y10]GLB48776.1 hypothetical protein Y10_11440 [Neptunitalea sp. Y10]